MKSLEGTITTTERIMSARLPRALHKTLHSESHINHQRPFSLAPLRSASCKRGCMYVQEQLLSKSFLPHEHRDTSLLHTDFNHRSVLPSQHRSLGTIKETHINKNAFERFYWVIQTLTAVNIRNFIGTACPDFISLYMDNKMSHLISS